MSRRDLTSFIVAVLVLGACRADRAPPSPASSPPKPSVAPVETPPKTAPPAATPKLQFLEVVTAGADASKPLPMVIAVHGLGDRPEAFIKLFEGFSAPVRLIVPRAPTRMRHGGGAWMTTRMAENKPEKLARELRNSGQAVAALAETLRKSRPTVGRPIITGFSQGGMVSFQVAAMHPEVFSAAFPIGGWLPPSLWPKQQPKGNLPIIRALHGTDDPIVPYAPTERAVAALKAVGFDATLTGFPGVRHAVVPKVRSALFEHLRRHVSQGDPSRKMPPDPQ